VEDEKKQWEEMEARVERLEAERRGWRKKIG